MSIKDTDHHDTVNNRWGRLVGFEIRLGKKSHIECESAVHSNVQGGMLQQH